MIFKHRKIQQPVCVVQPAPHPAPAQPEPKLFVPVLPKQSSLCFWSVGTERYAEMLQLSVSSYRKVGMTHDFHVFTDRPIKGATNHSISQLSVDSYFFKLKYLREKVKGLPYEWYVYVDADTYWVRPNYGIQSIFENCGCRSFCVMESKISDPAVATKSWRGMQLANICELFRREGVICKRIYNTNGGFFAVHRDSVDAFCDEVERFRGIASKAGWRRAVDETAICYAVHKMNGGAVDAMTVNANPDLWACDNGTFRGRIPDNRAWEWRMWFGGVAQVRPAIIHLFNQKELLLNEAKKMRIGDMTQL